jgi:hypothetical protein
MSEAKVVAVGTAPSASMRLYTSSACSGCPLRLQALMIVLYVRTSGKVPCAEPSMSLTEMNGMSSVLFGTQRIGHWVPAWQAREDLGACTAVL